MRTSFLIIWKRYIAIRYFFFIKTLKVPGRLISYFHTGCIGALWRWSGMQKLDIGFFCFLCLIIRTFSNVAFAEPLFDEVDSICVGSMVFAGVIGSMAFVALMSSVIVSLLCIKMRRLKVSIAPTTFNVWVEICQTYGKLGDCLFCSDLSSTFFFFVIRSLNSIKDFYHLMENIFI